MRVAVDPFGQRLGRLQRIREAALHHLVGGEEHQVVRVVHQPVHAVRRGRGQIDLVGGGAQRIRVRRPGVVSGARVDVRRHVHDVA